MALAQQKLSYEDYSTEYLLEANVSSKQLVETEASVKPNYETTYQNCLLTSVWSQSRLVATLLNKVGLDYKRVFNAESLELFLGLINHDLEVCRSIEHFNVNEFYSLSEDLVTLQTELLSSIDLLVVDTIKNAKIQTKNTSIIDRLLGKHKLWETSADSHMKQVILPLLEKKLARY